MGLVVVVLAAPVAWQLDGVRGEIELQQSVSGMLLMLMVARRVLFDDQVAAQQWVEDSPMRAGKYLATLYVGNGLMLWAFNRDRNGETRFWDGHWDMQRMLATLKQWMPVALERSVLVALSLSIHAGGVFCTAYLTSCLPWARFLFGKCASSPSLSGLALLCGSFIYSGIFMISELLRQYRSCGRADRTTAAVLWEQLEIGANVIGWACLFANASYVALEIFL